MEAKSILIVDDAPDNLLLLEMMLEDKFNIIEADSGMLCLELIAESLPDLLLLDVNMPGMTGYEVCEQLRKTYSSKELPIIFVSAMINEEEKENGFKVGGDGYITKPVDEDLLIQTIYEKLNSQ